MYTTTIIHKDTGEAVRCEHTDLVTALRLFRVAYFASGYNDEVLTGKIVDEETGMELDSYWDE